jgi:N-acetylglucosamine kinase-like BadF-type ATPase
MEAGAQQLLALAADARSAARLDARATPAADLAVVCAAGADLRSDVDRLTRRYLRDGLGATVVVANDTHAALRAGTDAGWGIAVVCGAGINCIGVAPDGREARFPGLGPISGDWGGGGALGEGALWAAIRARDGRGPRTALERLVPDRFGLGRPLDVTMAIYRGRLPEERLADLAPDVFTAAAAGDAVARALLDRLAGEVVAMARSVARRLGITRSRPAVVLAGGVFRTDDAPFLDRIRDGLDRAVARAPVAVLDVPPVVGAALLALDTLDRPDRPAAAARLRAAVSHAAMEEGR